MIIMCIIVFISSSLYSKLFTTCCSLPVLSPLHICVAYIQCWGKLLLKVMHYNIALLSKKVTNYVTLLLLMESNVLYYFCVTFALLFKYEQGLIVCF